MSDKSLKFQLHRVRSASPAGPKSTPFPAAPKHLDGPERRLWREIGSDFASWDAASLATLRSGLEAHARMRQSREAIESDGATFRDRFGQLRPHPLIAAERDARTAFIATLRALHLLEPEDDR